MLVFFFLSSRFLPTASSTTGKVHITKRGKKRGRKSKSRNTSYKMADFTCASVHVYLCSLYLRDGLAKIALPLRKKKKRKTASSAIVVFFSSLLQSVWANKKIICSKSLILFLPKKKKQVYAIALYSLKTASFWLK